MDKKALIIEGLGKSRIVYNKIISLLAKGVNNYTKGTPCQMYKLWYSDVKKTEMVEGLTYVHFNLNRNSFHLLREGKNVHICFDIKNIGFSVVGGFLAEYEYYLTTKNENAGRYIIALSVDENDEIKIARYYSNAKLAYYSHLDSGMESIYSFKVNKDNIIDVIRILRSTLAVVRRTKK